MDNSTIERQRKELKEFEESQLSPVVPVPPPVGDPPTDPSQTLPGQEPPIVLDPGTPPAPAAPDAPVLPQAPSPEVETLKQKIILLEGQVQEFQSLYQRQHGMVVPLQRKTEEQLRTIQTLTRQVEDLKAGMTPGTPTPARTTQPDSQQALSEEDRLFQETYGDMIPGLTKLIEGKLAPVKPTIDYVEQTRQREEHNRTVQDHLRPLYAPYPNAGAIVASPQFREWVEKHSFSSHIAEIVTNPELYPIQQVIKVFDDFSQATKTPASPIPQTPPVAPSPGEMAVDTRRIQTSSTPSGSSRPQPLTAARHAFLNAALTRNKSDYTTEQLNQFRAELENALVMATQEGRGLTADAAS